LRIGLIHQVAGDLDAAVERVLAELLSAGPEAARAAKELARAPQSAEETARSIAAHRTSPEGQEGLRAFLEKRPASWRQAYRSNLVPLRGNTGWGHRTNQEVVSE
jgi:methylglutaconyl-CoA hydratase